jgi:arginyl-tRNA synthetase
LAALSSRNTIAERPPRFIVFGKSSAMNDLVEFSTQVLKQAVSFRDDHATAHSSRSYPKAGDDALSRLKRRIEDALSAHRGEGRVEPRYELIPREKFGGDLALRFPQLLAAGGPKVFIKDHLPWITAILSSSQFADAIARVETKGMYLNLTLADRWLLDSAQSVVDGGLEFGANDSLADRVMIVDYSSPNVAKTLHAGHIRSTIIGHVLANLYESCGALVYRINHINDFGGFGFILEGYRRFKDQFPAGMGENDRLLEVYRIRRTAERAVENGLAPALLSAEDRETIERYFPGVTNADDLKRRFAEYVAASDLRFSHLEDGWPEEVSLWREMVSWSLKDFDRFYTALHIRFDLILGESFYFQAGDEVVAAALQAGSAVVYSEAEAAADISLLEARLDRGEITPVERDSLADAIRKDLGAVLVRLDDGQRYVVRRADGLSIYSTRDLGAIKLRIDLFHPTDCVYVVGQEQQVHFDRLFKTAYKIGLAMPDRVRFQHLYFGFYTDAKTGKKLSSRDSAANVNQLLARSVSYFRQRLTERVEQNEGELDNAARQLAVGSLVFNDLKQDMKGAVEINTTDLDAVVAGFEQSGGAYLVYSACRARSILRKHGEEPRRAAEIATFEINDQEAALLLKLQEMPERVIMAGRESNPSVLVRYLLDLASLYNSYYASHPVITSGVANPSRLLITKAVQVTLTNGLKLCHVECPQMI